MTEVLLARIIAGGLAIVDGLLGHWVDLTPGATNNACYLFPTYEAGLNACGLEFVNSLGQLISALVDLAPAAIAGLFATKAA